MKHVYSLAEANLPERSIVTIGVFDGVHKGHQYLIQRLVEEAHSTGRLAVALTFFPHPDAVLRQITGPYYLTTPEQRAEELTKLGVDWVITETFDDHFRRTPAADYVQQLAKHINMRELWIGQNVQLNGSSGIQMHPQQAKLRTVVTITALTTRAMRPDPRPRWCRWSHSRRRRTAAQG